jgi:hypothetical protein
MVFWHLMGVSYSSWGSADAEDERRTMVVSAGRAVWKEIRRVSLGRDRTHERHPFLSTTRDAEI